MREKSYVEDIDRSIYDFKDDEKDAYKVKAGLTPEISHMPARVKCAVLGWHTLEEAFKQEK